jgi:hypothetical protein
MRELLLCEQPVLDVIAVLPAVDFVAVVGEPGNLVARGMLSTAHVFSIQSSPVMAGIMTSAAVSFMTPLHNRREWSEPPVVLAKTEQHVVL